MSTRQNTRPNPPPPSSASARQNEYFVPRDGIDREVITSDICRYLGNDALVRPGTYESPDGRVIQGYFITAYRNLTSAMIQDLKADSARWEQERRAASRTGGGTTHSSQVNGTFVRSSNSPLGSREQARGQSDYSAWKNRQERAQDFDTTYPSSAMDIDYPAAQPAKAPGGYPQPPYSGIPAAVGYGAPAAYPPQPLGGAPAPYSNPAYGYAPNPPTQYSPGPQAGVDRYPPMAAPPVIPTGFDQNQGVYVHGSNYSTNAGYATAGQARPLGVSSAAASRSLYTPAVAAPSYGPDTTDPYGYSATSSEDVFMGRAPAGTTQAQTRYPSATGPQYDEASDFQAPPTSATSTTPQLPTAGGPNPRRDRDSEPREQPQRDHRDHRPRRSEQDRDDRHRSHRHGHR